MKTRHVIEDVPAFGSFPDIPCPEDLPFPACMRVLAEYLGDDRFGCVGRRPADGSRTVPCANKFFVGVSGIGFAMNWKWEPGGFNLLNLDSHPEEHIRRCFEALGLEVSIIANREHELASHFSSADNGGKEELKAALQGSIDRGMPCIAFGVLSIPEACLVTGYDDHGEVLIGRSVFQGFEELQSDTESGENGHFRSTGWYDRTVCAVIPGGRVEQPRSLSRICLDAVKAGLRLMRGGDDVHGYTGGLSAYDALVSALQEPGAFPADDETRFGRRAETINFTTGDVAEAKCYNGEFFSTGVNGGELLLENAADPRQVEAARGRIERVAGCYAVIHDLMWNAWEAERGDSLTEGWPVADHSHKRNPDVGGNIARIYLKTKSLEEEIYEHLSEALEILEGGNEHKPLCRAAMLEEVPYIGFDSSKTGGEPKTTYMAAAMEAALEAIGEEGYGYTYIMGVSGTAFRLHWNCERWDGGNISTLWMDDDPLDHYRRIFRAAGWTPLFLGNQRWRPPVEDLRSEYMGIDYAGDSIEYTDREEDFQHLLENSIYARHYPVLSLATIFPPEAGIICGYDPVGNTVSGYHHFQVFPENVSSENVTFDAKGRYIKKNWFEDTIALIAFHHKTSKPPVVSSYRNAVKTALALITTPRFRRHFSGLAAYRAWADKMGEAWGRDVLEDPGEMGLRLMCNNDAIACIGEGRAQACDFMKDASRVLPEHAEELQRVSSLYGEVAATAQNMIETQGGFRGDPGVIERLREQEVRTRLSELIDRARGIEEEIAGILEGVCDTSGLRSAN